MKNIKKIYKPKKINMGNIILDQALPVDDLNYHDPFLLIHHWKQKFHGGEKQSELGVGPHPHRGFTPVTLIFEGGVYHQDSSGNRSLVEKGGTQWMNSGKGIIHSERPSGKLALKGGLFEIIQFWLNIPKKYKKDEPDYQSLNKEETPVIISDGGLVRIYLIAGKFNNSLGKINTCSELTVLRIDISNQGKVKIPLKDGHNTLIYQLDGKLLLNNTNISQGKNLCIFEKKGDEIEIECLEDSRLIILSGEPLNEPVVSYGPFVMNSKKEIQEAIEDFHQGKMGELNEKFPEDQSSNN